MTQVGTRGWVRVAGAVAAAFSALAIIAGTRVLTGVDKPDYVVLPWLVRYNVAAGLGGVAVGAGLWLIRPWAVTGAAALAAMHGSVLVSLLGRWVGGYPVAKRQFRSDDASDGRVVSGNGDCATRDQALEVVMTTRLREPRIEDERWPDASGS